MIEDFKYLLFVSLLQQYQRALWKIDVSVFPVLNDKKKELKRLRVDKKKRFSKFHKNIRLIK